MQETDDPEHTRDSLAELGKQWLDRINRAEKREQSWRDSAAKAQAAFLADDETDAFVLPAFNILHSNVATMCPAIYNSTPSPDIRPRHNQADPALKLLAQTHERAIAAAIDDNALDSEVEAMIQDGEVAGRGVLRIRFDSLDDGQGERVIYEAVSWKDYVQGPAQRWSQVQWVAFKHTMTKLDVLDLADDQLRRLQVDPQAEPQELEEEDICVWEIWDKRSRRVLFIVESPQEVLKIEADPMGLSGFFPMVEPYQPIGAAGVLTPVCPFDIYSTLAEELDRITKRINGILRGMKAKGIVGGAAAEDIELWSSADDNSITVAQSVSAAGVAGGMNGLISWWPIEQAAAVVAQLYVQRDQTKQSIFEITGISDIVRGASNVAETATAQSIKAQWGSLRIQKRQKLVQRLVRDAFKITAEMMHTLFRPERVAHMAGVDPTPEMLQLLQQPLDHFRIDVESDSTIRADLTQRRGELAEFIGGMAQFIGVATPLAKEQPAAAAPLAEMVGAFARTFNMSKQVEDAVDELIAGAKAKAQNPEPDPRQQEAQQKAQAEQQRMQIDMQKLELEGQKLAMEWQKFQAEHGLKGQQAQGAMSLDLRKQEADEHFKLAELRLESTQRRPVEIGNG